MKIDRIEPRDSVETIVDVSESVVDIARNAKIDAFKKRGYLILDEEKFTAPSHSDGTVYVVHIYYRKLKEE